MKDNWKQSDEETLNEYKQLNHYYRDRVKLFVHHCVTQQRVLAECIKDPRKVDNNKNISEICCTFCGRTYHRAKRLVAGPNGAYICDECVEICSEIINEEIEKS